MAYLHLWKPRPLSTGLSFLPTFHIIILPQDSDPESPDLTVQLMTFHGKVILEDQITAPDGKVKNSAPLTLKDLSANGMAAVALIFYSQVFFSEHIDLKHVAWKVLLKKGSCSWVGLNLGPLGYKRTVVAVKPL